MVKHKVLLEGDKGDMVEKVWKNFVRSTVRENEFEKNEDVITLEESESRIINIEIFLAIMFSLIASTIATHHLLYNSNEVDLKHSPQNVISDKEHSVMTIANLALIYDNGSLVQAYFDRNLEVSMTKELVQLPKAKAYFMMTYKSTLLIAYSDATRKMTQYDPNLNENGHATVPKSGIDPVFDDWEGFYSFHGIQVGSMFWLLGRRAKNKNMAFMIGGELQPQTYIWYQNRQKWIKGPDLHSSFFNINFCAVSLNSSSVMIIGGYSMSENQRLVFVYEFQLKSWIQYPDILFDRYLSMWHCSAIVMMDKDETK